MAARSKRRSDEENEDPGPMNKKNRSASATISGRVHSIELENFMCHERLKVDFDTDANNCFYIGGPNGSGKSALFAGLNIGLGGRGSNNDRGSSVKGYIKEGKNSCKIRVVLTNRGQGAHQDFDDFAVIERTFSKTGSNSYSLKTIKGGRETKVSSKKGDLDKLMHRYGIQLTNPIFWMSQDRSRNFLQQMKPDKLFQIFMFATELEETGKCYEAMKQAHKDMNALIEMFNSDFAKRRALITKIKQDKERRGQIEKFQKELVELAWYLLWFPLRDAKELIVRLEKKKETFLAEQEKKKIECNENRAQRTAMNEKMGELTQELNDMEGDQRGLHDAYKQQEKCKNIIGLELNNLKQSVEEKEKMARTQKREIVQMEKSIARVEMERKTNSVRVQRETLERNIEEMQREINDTAEKHRAAQQEAGALQDEQDQANQQLQDIKSEKYNIERDKQRLQEQIRRAKAMDADAIARFGPEVPLLLKEIDKQSDRFTHKPLGPIGRFIALPDHSWAFAVEEAVNVRKLRFFVVHDHNDRRTLESICRQLRMKPPEMVVSNFNHAAHDTTRNEPPSQFMTVDRAIKISSHVVRNVLIDTERIESILLIESDREARTVLDGRCPPNVVRAYTKTGGKGFGRSAQGGQYRNSLGGPTDRVPNVYRFYPNLGDPTPRFLIQRRTGDEREVQQKIDALTRRADELSRHLRQEEDGMRSKKKELLDATRRTAELDMRKAQLLSKKRDLKRRLDNLEEKDDDAEIINLRSTHDELQLRLDEIEEERASLEEQLEEVTEKLKEAQHLTIEAKKKFKEEQSKGEPLEKEVEKLKKEMDTHDATYERLNEARRRFDQMLEKTDDEFVRLDKMKDEALEKTEQRFEPKFANVFKDTGGKPARYSDPPNFDEMPETETATSAYQALEDKIREAQLSMSGNTVSDSDYREMCQSFNDSSTSYKRLRRIHRAANTAAMTRSEKFPLIKYAITMKLKNSFSKLMAMRNYTGELLIRSSQKVIDIRVHTHKNNQHNTQGTQVVQDLKGLSGGERSYTTACFIMSLWEIMEAPFRCMDEFDVFMDMVNRKVVMDLLVKLATEQYPQNQFIFFTPQGIRELGQRDRVQIFEMPKVREN